MIKAAFSSKGSKEPSITVMFLLICIGSTGAVLFTPALPIITEFFNIPEDVSELTMTLYLIGYAIGQLFYGPVASRFGRKPAILLGLTICSAGAFLSILSYYFAEFTLLVISRFIFGFGSSVGLQLMFTIVGDYYEPPRNSKIASILTLAFTIGPSIGVTIGGFLTQYLGWQSCFYFLLVFSIILLFLSRLLPETCKKKDMSALTPTCIYRDYFQKIKNPKVFLGAVLVGSTVAFAYIFATAAPFISIEHIGLDPSTYGLWNLMPSAGFIIGSLISVFLCEKISRMNLLLFSIILTAIGSVVMFILFSMSILHVLALFIPYTVTLIGQPIIEANVICLGMEHNKNKATTSAIMHFINLSISVLAVLLISLPKTVVPISLPIIFILLSVLTFILFVKFKRSFSK